MTDQANTSGAADQGGDPNANAAALKAEAARADTQAQPADDRKPADERPFAPAVRPGEAPPTVTAEEEAGGEPMVDMVFPHDVTVVAGGEAGPDGNPTDIRKLHFLKGTRPVPASVADNWYLAANGVKRAEAKAKEVVAKVIHWSNGHIMAFGPNDNPVEAFTGPAEKVLARLRAEHPDAVFVHRDWKTLVDPGA